MASTDHFELKGGQSIQAGSGTWYRNLEFLGAGGNAATFLVVATSGPNRGVLFAAKVFRKRSKPERRDDFLREIGFLQTYQHPSVMRVFDSGTYRSDHPFLIAEYLPSTLRRVMQGEPRSLVARLSFTLQLLSALTDLHAQDPPIVHRDIKPENIFVKGYSCVLGDFGLMRRSATQSPDDDREFIRESVGVGMPRGYRTPELVAYLNGGVPPDPKSDVFQLGLVLAELFTGQNPLRQATGFTEPIELDRVPVIRGNLGLKIQKQITWMLESDTNKRWTASQLMNPWEKIFQEAVGSADALEGRVLW